MKAIRLSFFQMAAAMRRDMMLFASCFAPILAGFFFRFAIPLLEAALTDGFHMTAVISPYYRLIDILLAMLPSTMFCFVSAMGVPSVIPFFTDVIVLPVFKLTALSPLTVLLLSAGGTLQGMIVALLVLTISSNKLEGMAVTKLSTLTVFGAAIPFFIKTDIQYIISPLPSFWIGKAILENTLFYMFPAFVLSAVWIWFLLKRYLHKI